MKSILIIGEKKYFTNHCEILESYWNQYGSRPSFVLNINPTIKGYQDEWVLRDNRLYLTRFTGVTWELFKLGVRNVSFEDVFPDKPLPWFATWFNGCISFQVGEEVMSDHHFGSILKYCINLDFKNGILMNSEIVDYGQF